MPAAPPRSAPSARRPARAAVLALVLATTATAGCGGGSDDSGGEALSASSYRAEAARLCAATSRKLKAVEQPDFRTDAVGTERYFSTFSRLLDENVTQLRALDGPAEQERDMERFLTSADRVVSTTKMARRYAAEKDSAKFDRTVARIEPRSRTATRLARAGGFDGCDD